MKTIIQLLALFFLFSGNLQAIKPIRLLIVDGRNNHNWQITTDALRATLEATGRKTPWILKNFTGPRTNK
jgi:hypothetical protein